MKIPIKEYIEHVKQGEIPPYPSKECNRWDWDSTEKRDFDNVVNCYRYREECTERGMWPKLDMIFMQELAGAIGKRSVLEVMSGAGFIGKGLSSQGIEIICTDNYSWKKVHKKMNGFVHPVRKCRADHAIRKWGYKSDILLVSWPPYGCEEVIKMMDFWDHSKPIIYIGEFDGCNAPEEFTNCLNIEKHFNLQVWDGLHDDAVLAYYEER